VRLTPALLCAFTTTAVADVELKNDSFAEGDQVAFQGGFVSGEIGAARFVAPEAGRQLLKVQLLFGGATTTQTVTALVYDDTAGETIPGTVLYRGEFQITGSNTALHELLIADLIVTVPAQFRVGIQVVHDNAPSIAADTDGPTGSRNFIFALSPGGDAWIPAPGAIGDWVIRAFVSGDGASNTPCAVNPECPVGEFCDTAAGACTFECRTDPDCGDGSCNSLGQCVATADDGGGGCCGTARDPQLAMLLGLLLLRRRRCAR